MKIKFPRNRAGAALFAAIFLVLSAGIASAAANYYQPNIKLETFINDGSVVQPTAFQFAPDGRMFIAQRNGDVKIVWKGNRTANGLKHIEVDSSQEHGLLNIALDPNFTTNPYMYFYYNGPDAKVRIAKAKVNLDNIEPLQELWVARGASTSQNHQGGGLDVDNYNQILFSTGDNYVSSNAQDPTNDFGKIFRIKTDGTAPADNPYLNVTGASPALFAIGVRNPFRLTVDRVTNSVYVGDVGQSAYEEINKIDKGKNYGWPYQEGNNCTGDCSGFVTPLYTYAHPAPGDYFTTAAVTLGHAYYGSYYGGMFNDKILFADGMQGRLDMLSKTGTPDRVLSGIGYIVDTTNDGDGRIYLLDYYSGKISRINYGTNLNDEPYANPACTPASAITGTAIICQANAGDQNNDPLTYTWTLSDGRTFTGASPNFSFTTPGQYKVRLNINDTHTTVTFPPVNLSVGEKAQLELTSPDISVPISAGQTLNYQIMAKEADGTVIDNSKVKLSVKFQHNTHAHDFITDQVGKSGTVSIPTNIETDLDIWLRFYITATDRNGVDTTITRDLYYNEAALKLTSIPDGAPITVDGTLATSPDGFIGVTGVGRTLETPDTYAANGVTYKFSNWSDGNTNRSRTISFPAAMTNLTAVYVFDASLNPTSSLLPNSLFEQTSGGVPTGWSIITSAGTTGIDRYDVAHTGAFGCQVSITARSVSSLRGCAATATIEAGKSYQLQSWYKANRYSYVYAEYYNGDTLLDKVQVAKSASAASWTKLNLTLQSPTGANKVKVYQVIDGVGTLAVDDYSLTLAP